MSRHSVMRISLYLYIFMGGWRYADVEIVNILLIMGGVVFVVNSSSGYVLNK